MGRSPLQPFYVPKYTSSDALPAPEFLFLQIFVIFFLQDGPTSSEGTVTSTVSSDGWVPVKWDSGARNTYRMGKDGKYDLQLAPLGDESSDKSVENDDENTKGNVNII